MKLPLFLVLSLTVLTACSATQITRKSNDFKPQPCHPDRAEQAET